MPEIASGQSLEAIDHAVALLNAGLLIGMPTETVYGLAADADNADAVASIFVAKGRPADHPLIVHLGADDLLGHYAREIPEAAWTLAEAFWPGPLTMILKKAPDVSDVVTGGRIPWGYVCRGTRWRYRCYVLLLKQSDWPAKPVAVWQRHQLTGSAALARRPRSTWLMSSAMGCR